MHPRNGAALPFQAGRALSFGPEIAKAPRFHRTPSRTIPLKGPIPTNPFGTGHTVQGEPSPVRAEHIQNTTDYQFAYTSNGGYRQNFPGGQTADSGEYILLRANNVENNRLIMTEQIGFVGVGRMGANMARRLKTCGFAIATVYDAHRETAEALAAELGCGAAADLKEVTRSSDIIITVVSDDKAMKQIYLGGLLSRARGKLFINCATVTPGIHVWVEQKAEKAGAQSLEACMASSIPQAQNGTLYLMCAGKAEAFERAKPLLEKLSSSMRYVGAAGTAAQVKAIVNMVMNINTAGLAEGLALGDALGLDVTMLREVLGQTGAASRVLQTDGEDMQNREHSCYLLRRPCRERLRHRPQTWQTTRPLSAAGRCNEETIRPHGRTRAWHARQIGHRRTHLQRPRAGSRRALCGECAIALEGPFPYPAPRSCRHRGARNPARVSIRNNRGCIPASDPSPGRDG